MATCVQRLVMELSDASVFVSGLSKYVGSTPGLETKIRSSLICASPRGGPAKKFSTLKSDFVDIFGKMQTALGEEHNIRRWMLDTNAPSIDTFWAYAALLTLHYLERDRVALAERLIHPLIFVGT
jgi:hypothetical protein